MFVYYTSNRGGSTPSPGFQLEFLYFSNDDGCSFIMRATGEDQHHPRGFSSNSCIFSNDVDLASNRGGPTPSPGFQLIFLGFFNDEGLFVHYAICRVSIVCSKREEEEAIIALWSQKVQRRTKESHPDLSQSYTPRKPPLNTKQQTAEQPCERKAARRNIYY